MAAAVRAKNRAEPGHHGKSCDFLKRFSSLANVPAKRYLDFPYFLITR
jgi:hypothetical protein